MANYAGGRARKKLTAASRHWATGGRASTDEQIKQFKADAERFGIPLDVLIETLPEVAEDFEIWPENEESLTLFLSLSGQWDYADGRIQRMNYPSLYAVMQMLETKDKPQMFHDMQLMEREALKEFSKR